MPWRLLYRSQKTRRQILADEYYVVEKTSPAISKEAMAYGKMPEEDSHVLLYSFAEERQGYKIIEYEIYRYQIRHGIYADGQTSLRDIAFYNMEYHPEYFGTYPVPLATLRGRTARYKLLMNGVFWIETGTGAEVLAVCYPIWNCDFSETVLKQLELPLFLACIIIPFGFMARLIKFGFALGQLSYMAPNLDPIQDFLATPEQRRPEKPVKLGERSFRFDRVCFSYDGKKEVLHDVSFTARTGQITAIVGPSGSGKSTIIKLLTGEVEPCAGRIMINGFSVSNISDKQIPLMRRTLGVIFQDFRLIEKKTVFENLEFVMRAVGASPKEIRKRIPYVLDLVGLGNKAESFPTELSGGEQQRVAIARALVNNPNTIIADEPTGNLDPERSLELMSLLVKINQLGTTVVVVTHEKDLVDRFGKRVVTIESGHVINDSVGGYVGGHIHGQA